MAGNEDDVVVQVDDGSIKQTERFLVAARKMAATVRDADERKLFAWDIEDVQPRNAALCEA